MAIGPNGQLVGPLLDQALDFPARAAAVDFLLGGAGERIPALPAPGQRETVDRAYRRVGVHMAGILATFGRDGTVGVQVPVLVEDVVLEAKGRTVRPVLAAEGIGMGRAATGRIGARLAEVALLQRAGDRRRCRSAFPPEAGLARPLIPGRHAAVVDVGALRALVALGRRPVRARHGEAVDRARAALPRRRRCLRAALIEPGDHGRAGALVPGFGDNLADRLGRSGPLHHVLAAPDLGLLVASARRVLDLALIALAPERADTVHAVQTLPSGIGRLAGCGLPDDAVGRGHREAMRPKLFAAVQCVRASRARYGPPDRSHGMTSLQIQLGTERGVAYGRGL